MAHRSNIVFSEGSSQSKAEDYVELEEQIGTIRRPRSEAGRSDLPFDIRAFASNLDDIKRCEEIGVTSINASPDANAKSTKDYFTDWIKQYADEVISKVS